MRIYPIIQIGTLINENLTNKNVIWNSRANQFLNFIKKRFKNKRLIFVFIKVPYQNSLEDDELEVVNGYNKNIVDNQHYF